MNRKELTLYEYQQQAMSTRMETCNNFSYMFINLVGELGEFASKVAKAIRKDKVDIHFNELCLYTKQDDNEGYFMEESLMLEAGDILWQLTGLCDIMGWSLEDIAQNNLDKLKARKAAGTIDGNGDGVSGKDRVR